MIGIVYGTYPDPDGNYMRLSGWQSAGLKAVTLIGNLVGQLLFGWLADIIGRKRMYGIELVIMIIATFGQAVSGQGPALNPVGILIVWRFILGVGVGGDHPLSAVITSEFASTRFRGRLMTVVFPFQAASLAALVIVTAFEDDIDEQMALVDYTWRLLIGLGCIPAVIALYFRLTITETPRFTMDIERRAIALYVDNIVLGEPRVTAPHASGSDFISYFSQLKNLKVLFGTAYSWFALDVAFYMLTLNSGSIISRAIYSSPIDTYYALWYLCVANIVATVAGCLPGFVASFLLIDVMGRKPIQLMGFITLTILFWIIGFADFIVGSNFAATTALLCLANFFQNFGPNTTTFIVPGEAFPTRYRSTAYGVSAACGKLGAAVSQCIYLIGCVSSTCDVSNTGTLPAGWQTKFKVLSFFMMIGVLSTLLIPETKNRTLEDLSNEDQEKHITGTTMAQGVAVPLAPISAGPRWV